MTESPPEFDVDRDGIMRLNPLTGFHIAQPPDTEGVALCAGNIRTT